MDKIILNDGTKDIEFEIIDTFGVDDKEYCALLSPEQEIYIMQMEFEGKDAIFKTIDNPKEFDQILALYLELLDESEQE